MTMRTDVDPTAAVGAVQGVIGWLTANPLALAVIGFVIIVVLLVRTARAKRPVQTDPQRMFTAAQRAEAKRRAGGRCEHSFWGMRCHRPGEHADHIYPWSRGGATAMSNCQSLCQHHNLAKSAKIPSRFYISALARRRRAYFPEGIQTAVEWRQPLAA